MRDNALPFRVVIFIDITEIKKSTLRNKKQAKIPNKMEVHVSCVKESDNMNVKPNGETERGREREKYSDSAHKKIVLLTFGIDNLITLISDCEWKLMFER